jgi:beta-N-acetylhexosaminidase
MTHPRVASPTRRLTPPCRIRATIHDPMIYGLVMQRIELSLALLFLFAIPAFARQKNQSPAPVQLKADGQKWAEKTLRKLSLEEKVGQIFMVRVNAGFLNAESPDYQLLRNTIRQHHLGSLIVSVPFDFPFLEKTGPYEAAELLNRLQQDSRLPLLIAADFERGIATRITAGTEFPHAMAFGATGKTEYAEAFGRITALEARAIGVQWNFFPDTDVNSNPANPIINTRSFGSDPQQVGDLAAAYIRGAKANGMLTTVKHFPGHGDTATDSHLGVARVAGDLERLRSVELPPFRRAIEAGVDAVMVAHVTVPALESDPNRVATTSAAVVTGLLKGQMNFQGIVVTDALDMAGLTRLYQRNGGRAAVEAFQAGNDVLLMPVELGASYRSLLQAVRSGEIPSAQLDASVLKMLKLKASVGLHQARTVDLAQLARLVGRPENIELAQRIANDAITLVRDNGKVLPLKKIGTGAQGLPYQNLAPVLNRTVVVLFSDDVRTGAGRTFDREFRHRIPDAQVIYADAHIASGISDQALAAVDQAQAVIVAVEVAPTAGKMERAESGLTNSVALPEANGALLKRILDRGAERTMVVALGNPFLASDFPEVQNYMCAFSNASVSEVSAVKALFGEISIRGHLPVNIPAIAEQGAGIERSAMAD